MSNFTFLKQEWPGLYEAVREAERAVNRQPRTSCFYARFAMELGVKWLFDHDDYLKRPYNDNLDALIHEPTFQDNLMPGMLYKLRFIKSKGNQAVHSEKKIGPNDGLQVLKEIHHFCFWLYSNYAKGEVVDQVFDLAKLPPSQKSKVDKSLKELQALESKFADQAKKQAEAFQTKLDASEEERKKLLAEVASLKAQAGEAKEKNQKVEVKHDYNEAETRKHIIDLMLEEAGWKLDAANLKEYPVTGMPTKDGQGTTTGRVDYVLWGENGKPLAVIEAKKTTVSQKAGKAQAKNYADCLEKMTGQRPLIFYTNGYETEFWDDTQYPPRPVWGFYKRDELQRLIDRRAERLPLSEAVINAQISDRHYQQQAIRSVTGLFEQSQRKALMVMATGTGKTRTVIALIDLLRRCNWIKNVLFLADRNALLTQAKKAFGTNLPDTSATILSGGEEAALNRICLATYPTMMNILSKPKKDGQRLYSPGHFDLIVIDEAHRSVYQKYKAIFDYYDSLLIGLTATPTPEIDHNTYHLFDLQTGVPTYSYELDQAVEEGHLVPSNPFSVPLKFMRDGIKYENLSEKDKAELEMEFDDDAPESGVIAGSADMYKWLFNADTVDKVLGCLMENGVKVAGGDELGKTIIFAKNRKHADFILDRFDLAQPQHKGKYARCIYSQDPYAQQGIDEFSTLGNPQIAISVDMLDTGIDVPEAVNLVFFKVVRSKVKFLQMMGRGTRLCKDLFGPGEHKTEFKVFDFCQNLEFFGQNPDGADFKVQPSLAKTLFRKRLELAGELKKVKGEDAAKLRGTLLGQLHQEVEGMHPDNFVVRPHRKLVEKYSKPEKWDNLNATDLLDLNNNLAGLPTTVEGGDELAKRFDQMILTAQLGRATGSVSMVAAASRRINQVARALLNKTTIPMIAAQKDRLDRVLSDGFWEGVSLVELEQVRAPLRELMRFLDLGDDREPVYTNFEDEIGELESMGLPKPIQIGDRTQYKLKVEAYIRANQEHEAIRKLRENEPLAAQDVAALESLLFTEDGVGDKDTFLQFYGEEKTLGLLIRQIVGMDIQAAKKAFGEFLHNTTYSAKQIAFIDQIIHFLAQKGTIERQALFESPFTDLHHESLFGFFSDDQADLIVGVLDQVSANAAIGVDS